MSAISDVLLVMIIMLAIFAACFLFIIGVMCIYYGAILIVLLSILKWFGVIAVIGVV